MCTGGHLNEWVMSGCERVRRFKLVCADVDTPRGVKLSIEGNSPHATTAGTAGQAVAPSPFEWHRQIAQLTRPADRAEWFLPPQTVTAYNFGIRRFQTRTAPRCIAWGLQWRI